jgi:hypothetical protein
MMGEVASRYVSAKTSSFGECNKTADVTSALLSRGFGFGVGSSHHGKI